jgi:adenine-specific DNA-methyltransferase
MPRGRKPKTAAIPEEPATEPVLADTRDPTDKKAKVTKASPAKTDDKKQIEQYEHKKEKRCNNPPIGLVRAETDPEGEKKTYQYDPHLDPQLQWAGKAEHTSFDVPTVSLHVHERIDPHTLINAVRKRNGADERQVSLFEYAGENPPIREAIEFYKHKHNWSNRLIAGDSLLVMNSLLAKEAMADKVQMIYIDPPYGIKYGSNFQPFVNKRDVKDGKDEDLTQEPEMIKAFRDTWELGIHSYLTYLRDRLLLARELLTDSGSVFVQISDENVHHVKELMDEIFGKKNYIAIIPFYKISGLQSNFLDNICDYLFWYGKNLQNTKYHKQFISKRPEDSGVGEYRFYETSDGNRHKLTDDEIKNPASISKKYRLFRPSATTSQGYTENGSRIFNYRGKSFSPGPNRHWSTSIEEGLPRLDRANRLIVRKDSISYIRYLNDFPVTPVPNIWSDTRWGFDASQKTYVVQTNTKVVERCILMTTDPGDLVLDPTCGSGTTAAVAEQWGRRWITCDTSRVAITLAKQRLMTSLYEYYNLQQPNEGISSGFIYQKVPHITLKSIALNLEIDVIYQKYQSKISKFLSEFNDITKLSLMEWEIPQTIDSSWSSAAKTKFNQLSSLVQEKQKELDITIQKNAPQEDLYNQPHVDKTRVRVTGPFTVEAVPSPTVKPLSEIEVKIPSDVSIARSGETLRQSEWRDELLRTGIKGKGGQKLEFSRVEPMSGTRWLHAEAATKDANAHRVVLSFGPEHAPLEPKQVELAIKEAERLVPKPSIVLFVAFQFDPEAAKNIDETQWKDVTLLKVQMNADLLTDDLKKKRVTNESFWLIGQPDVQLEKIKDGDNKGKYQVKVLGFDYYDTKNGTVVSGGAHNIAVWMLDTDYDGRSLYPRQVFFPMADEKGGWSRLARNLKAELDEDLIEAYHGTSSLPFKLGTYNTIAVKIVDDRGIESIKIIEVD